jgi:hypothetical protein
MLEQVIVQSEFTPRRRRYAPARRRAVCDREAHRPGAGRAAGQGSGQDGRRRRQISVETYSELLKRGET